MAGPHIWIKDWLNMDRCAKAFAFISDCSFLASQYLLGQRGAQAIVVESEIEEVFADCLNVETYSRLVQFLEEIESYAESNSNRELVALIGECREDLAEQHMRGEAR